ncbi:helix-turn-helix domain-containing protein [Flavobacterium sp. TN-1]
MKINKTDDYLQFIAMHRLGFTNKEISQKVGVSEQTVSKWLKNYNRKPLDICQELTKQNLEALHWRLKKLITQENINFGETERILKAIKEYNEANRIALNFEATSKVLDFLNSQSLTTKTTL